MKKTLSLFFVIYLLSSCAIAETLEQFGNSMSFFYVSPSENAFIQLQTSFEKFKPVLDQKGEYVSLLTAVMMARIAKKYSWPIPNGVLAEKANEVLEGNSEFAKYVKNDLLVDPQKLDIWWAGFFATGEDIYLEKLLKATTTKTKDGDTNSIMVAGAAKWSFKSNCLQHEKVRAFAKKKYAEIKKPGPMTQFLSECISSKSR